MKSVLAMIVLASLAMAAPANQDVNAVDQSDTSPFQNEITLFSAPGEVSAQAYCGGYSAAGCSNACYWLGYRCYACRSDSCFCTNSGC
ncbi:hypothetical protein N3K66_008369 [Trichothecium roseum]|uniref:Uncharacterized protein n=1 Tax=Trichothecium roseum TaxID=47278 RepID=A0ACC0UQH7_9HYPO|nr:hypothetical protein N3K66_008369 [Trichothecium roseum]